MSFKKIRLPNLSGLALTSPTGVTLNPADGSRTFTAEEFAELMRVLRQPRAIDSSSGTRTFTAEEHAELMRILGDEGSDDEEDKPLASRLRRRPRTMLEILKPDNLASILGAIGERYPSKKSACDQAWEWCNLTKDHQAACDIAAPDVWKDLAKRIFTIRYMEDVTNPGDVYPDGSNLIYVAYRDDDNPRLAFGRMCRALDLGNVLGKRFAQWAFEKYLEMLRKDERGLKNSRYRSSFSEETEWRDKAAHLFDNDPLSEKCKDTYREDETFRKTVDTVFSVTVKYLFEGNKEFRNLAEKESDELPSSESSEQEEEEDERSEGSLSGDDPGPDRYGIGREEAIYAIGEALGMYIVGIWQLQNNLSAWQDKYKDHDEHPPSDDYTDQEKEKNEQIKTVRVQIAYAVDRVLYGPTAMVPTEYAEYNDFQLSLYDDDIVLEIKDFDMTENEDFDYF